MSLVEVYAKRFGQHLSYHPVWYPGTAVAVGDVGVFEDGVFCRQGTLRQNVDVAFDVATNAMPTPMKFSVGVSLALDVGAGAQVSPAVRVAAKLSFENDGGVAFHATHVTQHYIDNVRAVLAAIPWNDNAWRDLVLVSEVFTAKSAAVVVSENGNAAIEVTGKAGPLRVLDLADAALAVGASSAATYSTNLTSDKGGEHPVALRIYRGKRGWFSSERKPEFAGFAPRPAAEADEPFEEVSPFVDG